MPNDDPETPDRGYSCRFTLAGNQALPALTPGLYRHSSARGSVITIEDRRRQVITIESRHRICLVTLLHLILDGEISPDFEEIPHAELIHAAEAAGAGDVSDEVVAVMDPLGRVLPVAPGQIVLIDHTGGDAMVVDPEEIGTAHV